MTIYEKIKAMSVEDMAKFIDGLVYGDIQIWHGFCDICDGDKENRCWECAQTWLESEVEENE